ncbi:hypothetical protein [Lentzea flava]|uniref:Excreted virulence factor EspC, type VII ESX diderm n=1 Tax=Lentzea flava TaxID=103732 RepID=A0ABQ2UTM9_9PSEU|nr:hypothetical protein [Lentzea flava]MCP2201225.1 hypothetical protein [Lentzea flava]GGU49746.1 hypothetical protein GCM10010178_48210 [Lentzea flava]
MTGFQVVTSALRAEAGKWDELSYRMAPVHRAVEGLTLSPLAFTALDAVSLAGFSLGLPTAPEQLARSYEEVRAFIANLLLDAEEEFSEVGDTLIKIADTYDEAEDVIELDLDQTY